MPSARAARLTLPPLCYKACCNAWRSISGSVLAWDGPTQGRAGEPLTLQLAVKSAEPLTLQLAVKSAEPLASLPLMVTFDPQLLQVMGVQEGGFLRQGGAAATFSSRVDSGGVDLDCRGALRWLRRSWQRRSGDADAAAAPALHAGRDPDCGADAVTPGWTGRYRAIATGACDQHRAVTMKRHRGFTLIELLVTLAVLSVLAMMALPVAQTSVQRHREQELRSALAEIRAAIDAYKRASDEGRVRREAGATGYPPSLEVLVEGEDDQRDPQRRKLYFLRRLPQDPMHSIPTDTPTAPWGLRSYRSPQDDPQEGEDVYDVYSKSPTTGLNGTAYRLW
jgi:general secretion pathway protein G